jgi:hypothetical protein
MARRRKPVDDSPIPGLASVRRIDPIWLNSRKVPDYFWDDRENRRNYLLWLGNQLGFRRMSDWYRLSFRGMASSKHGQRVKEHWGASALAAVEDCYPLYDWKPWLFKVVGPGFWESRANRQKYLAWLGERLGYAQPDDWYAVTIHDFHRNHGKGLMPYYQSSPVRAVMDLIPRRDWCEWKFGQIPMGFWDLPENRRRYFRWLGKELGFRSPEDWYRIQLGDIVSRHGSSLRTRFSSFHDLLRDVLPELDWDQVDPHRPLRIEEILTWADAHRARHGVWPSSLSGEIPECGQTWETMDQALRKGFRGLPRISLARLLAAERGVRFRRTPPDLSERQIMAWADAFFQAQGKWPDRRSGPIPGTTETWSAVYTALRLGRRGLPVGSSLARFLAQKRDVRNRFPPLTEEEILTWADAHFAVHGEWPTRNSGPIPGTTYTWSAIAAAMFKGSRGLRRYTLARLLAERRGVRNLHELPRLKEGQILAWADAYHAATGKWPTGKSGPISGANETWNAVATAMHAGVRGLRRGFSLSQLLARRRGVRNRGDLPPLKESQILTWADHHFGQTGRWPAAGSGVVAEAPGETWMAIEQALIKGLRGLSGGSSLARLISAGRGVRHRLLPPPLTEQQILAWAKAHYKATGQWPICHGGSISQSPSDTWLGVDKALRAGRRGLPGGSSLTMLLRKHALTPKIAYRKKSIIA